MLNPSPPYELNSQVVIVAKNYEYFAVFGLLVLLQMLNDCFSHLFFTPIHSISIIVFTYYSGVRSHYDLICDCGFKLNTLNGAFDSSSAAACLTYLLPAFTLLAVIASFMIDTKVRYLCLQYLRSLIISICISSLVLDRSALITKSLNLILAS